jgi:hypothetical protein
MKVIVILVALCAALLASCSNTAHVTNTGNGHVTVNQNIGDGGGYAHRRSGTWVSGGFAIGGPTRRATCSPSRCATLGPPTGCRPYRVSGQRWPRPCGQSCGGPTCGYRNCRPYPTGGHSVHPGYGRPNLRPQPIPRYSGYGPNTGIAGWLRGDSPPRGVTYYGDVTDRRSVMPARR